MKTKFTKAELIAQWLKRWPNDKDSPDLEFNALAGHVETNNLDRLRDAEFRSYKDWYAEKYGE